MYYVLRKMPPLSERSVWEERFCRDIAAYMTELVDLVNPTKGVYVSCDGVVCGAKRRQQRLRRFKGPWTSAAEAVITGAGSDSGSGSEKWDQNALTPGTAFMELLGKRLTSAGATLQARLGIPVFVSTTAEPGEGEHKLLRKMREVRPASCTIYGLDADLILLSMLLGVDTGATVSLLREAQEFEGGGAGGWRSLSVTGLTKVMIPKYSPERIRDYVAAMSLLGNDFLPKSLTRTVRDDGIPKLLADLETHCWSSGGRIVRADGSISRSGLLALVRAWTSVGIEEADMLAAAIEGRKVSRRHVGVGATPQETALREWNAKPAAWASICRILSRSNNALVEDWRTIYREDWKAGDAKEYCAGIAWVWDYYSGKPVDLGWHFEEHLPPLWSDVVAALERDDKDDTVAPPAIRWAEPLEPWQHLLSVLPAESARRLLPADKLGALTAYPWYWPTVWRLFDVGRSQMWECEPVIPVIPEAVVRQFGATDT